MKKTGKWLEYLAREIEKRFLPEGFEVLANERIFNDGVQIAEFDIIIKGTLGATTFKWLIECRDRPSKGSAPGSWIEQLIGRKHLFKFDKVIAISTTGFSKGAEKLAELGNIERRSVETLTVDAITEWFPLTSIDVYSMNLSVEHVKFVGAGDNDQVNKEINDKLKLHSTHPKDEMPMPMHPRTGKPLNVIADFYNSISQNPHLLNGFRVDGKSKPIRCTLKYSNLAERYQFVTNTGVFNVSEIQIEGKFTVTQSEVPITQISEYYKTSTGELISQSVRFTTDVYGQTVDLYFHNLGEKDKTFVSAQIEMTKETAWSSIKEAGCAQPD